MQTNMAQLPCNQLAEFENTFFALESGGAPIDRVREKRCRNSTSRVSPTEQTADPAGTAKK